MFLGLATLFAELLRPLAPSRAAELTDHKPVEIAAAASQSIKRSLETEAARPPIATTHVADVDKPEQTEVLDAAEPSAPIPNGPLVAIVLTELGPNTRAARTAIDRLPAAVSLAFSPYADASRELARAAKTAGHEVWLSVPMQPKSYPARQPRQERAADRRSGAENVRRLEWAMSGSTRPSASRT